ncbi:MAG: spondin domain-containing protein [Sulfurimonas sp.]
MKTLNILSSILLGSLMLFSGCSNSNDSATQIVPTYSLKITNLTAAQPMSPVLVSSNSIFSVGQSASAGLEQLAESGDNSTLLDSDSVSGTGLLTPSSSETINITTANTMLSIASMLVKTNDAFAGVEAYDVSSLATGESTTIHLNVYDAGTEDNSETNTTVPGPGGEGHNATRENTNIVTLHSGIISKDDGLMSSNLSAEHRFNNPAAMVVITRTN